VGKVMLAYSSEDVVARVVACGLDRPTPATITGEDSFLKELQRIREDAVASDTEETRHGVVCVGAPVFPPCDQLAAVSLTAPRGVNLNRAVPSLQETAAALTRALRRARPPAPATVA